MSENSACDFLLFLGDFGHPFFVIIMMVTEPLHSGVGDERCVHKDKPR